MSDRDFENLIIDRISGSTSLLISFINLTLTRLQDEKWDFTEFREYLDEFANSFLDMKTIQEFSAEIKISSDDTIYTVLENKLRVIDKQIQAILTVIIGIIEASHKGKILQIVTISNSYLICSIFTKLHEETNISFKLHVMESLPGGEGKKLFEDLNGKGVNSVYLTDKRFFSTFSSNNYDFFICSCDAYNDIGFINKVGTNKLIALGLESGIQLLVLTNKSKKSKKLEYTPISDLLEYCERKSNVVYIQEL